MYKCLNAASLKKFCFEHFDFSEVEKIRQVVVKNLGTSSLSALDWISTLLTCHSSNHGHSHSKGSRSSPHNDVQVHSSHKEDTGQLRLQQTSCHTSRDSHSVHHSIHHSNQDRVHSIRTRGLLQLWHQHQEQKQAQPRQISFRSSRSKGSRSSPHNVQVQVHSSLHTEDTGQPLDRQLPLLQLQARPWKGRPSREEPGA